MKLKQIEALLKSGKQIVICKSDDCQWLGNNIALYLICNLPDLNKENIFTLFDIDEIKKDKYLCEEKDLPLHLNFSDNDITEKILDRGTILLNIKEKVLEPLFTSQGIFFIDKRFLKPFADLKNGYELYERTDTNNNIYIVVKSGFMLLGVIMPYDLVNEKFVQTLEKWHSSACTAWINKQSKQQTDSITNEEIKEINL